MSVSGSLMPNKNWGQIPIVLRDVLVFVGAHPVRDGFLGRVPRPSPTVWAPTAT
jgi:hypothetical protein